MTPKLSPRDYYLIALGGSCVSVAWRALLAGFSDFLSGAPNEGMVKGVGREGGGDSNIKSRGALKKF